MPEYIFIAFLVMICIQFIYYVLVFGRYSFSAKKEPDSSQSQHPISVIICAKNEAENLNYNLPLFLNQNYPEFELILINDCSIDGTLEVFENFKNSSTIPVKVVNVEANEQFWGSKKYALTLGIKAATHDHLLLSDADCKPKSANWITEMASQFNGTKEIILGYGSYKSIKHSFLNKLIRFETLLTAVQYFSYAKMGIPYMGVGRNLAYTKQLFFKNNGFVSHMKIRSGDDDLFINQVGTQQNSAICDSKNSHTISEPKNSFKSWINQKARHVTTAKYYKPLHKLLLALFYSSQLLFWLTGITLMILMFEWEIVGILIISRFIIHYLVMGISAKKLGETDLVFWLPFLEIFLIFVQLFIFIKNQLSKPKNW
jgi:glycosyltransferase involved in cell wall biosynthesis